MNVDHDQPIWHAMESSSTLHGSLDVLLARFQDFGPFHQLDSLEEMNISFIVSVAFNVQRSFFDGAAASDVGMMWRA